MKFNYLLQLIIANICFLVKVKGQQYCVSIGCKSNTNGLGNTIHSPSNPENISLTAISSNSTYTINGCLTECGTNQYAVLQNQNKCYCVDDSFLTSEGSNVDDTFCDKTCNFSYRLYGDPEKYQNKDDYIEFQQVQSCGGSGYNNLYKLDTASTSNMIWEDNICKCIDKYYYNNNKCEECSVGCGTCKELNVCLTCDVETKYPDANGVCTACVSPCIKCHKRQICIECTADRHLPPDCPCKDKTYEKVTVEYSAGPPEVHKQSTCEACNHRCAKCDKLNECIECDGDNRAVNNLLPQYDTDVAVEGNSNCGCERGYYDKQLEILCQKCSDTIDKCVECSYDDTTDTLTCSACDSIAFIELRNNECVCIEGYYFNAGICEKCDIQCGTCETSANNCLTCSDSSRGTTNPCDCDPDSKKYSNGIAKQCQPCVYPCEKCSDANTCLTCQDPNNKSGPKCECDSNFTLVINSPDNQTCEQCAYHCQECQNQDINDCTECPASSNRTLEPNNCACDKNFYDDGTAICQPCNLNYCDDCSDATTCILCKLSSLRTPPPECECLPGLEQDSNGDCVPCAKQCKVCVDPIGGNSYGCSECSDSTRSGLPLCLCKPSYYDDGQIQCLKCPYPCLECTKETGTLVCITCVDNVGRLSDPDCTCDTANNYYQSYQTCLQCSFRCSGGCNSDKNDCVNCSHAERDPTNNCLCKKGFYENDQQAICQSCPTVCTACQNDTICTECQTGLNRHIDFNCGCILGFYENGGVCIECGYKCKSCIGNDSTCQECSDSTRFQPPECKCIDTYYNITDQIACQKCVSPCNTCIDDTQCKTCQQPSLRTPPLCDCNPGYYEVSNECVQCPYKCSTCDSSGQCTNCALNSNRSGIPDCNCDTTFFNVGTNKICLKCLYPCNNCQDSDICIDCYNNDVKRNVNDKCVCYSQYYEDQNKECQECGINCAECIFQADYCKVCNQPLHRVDKPKCDCKLGMYEVPQAGAIGTCLDCQYPCLSCVGGPQICIACKDQIGRKEPPVCSCDIGYFEDSEVCTQCNYKCRECSDANSCDVCAENRINLICECPGTTYNVEDVALCQPCSLPCLNCVDNANKCTSCSGNNRNLLSEKCECNQKFYEISLNNGQDCLPCEVWCTHCNLFSNQCEGCLGLNRQSEPLCECQTGHYYPIVSPGIDCLKCDINCYECQDTSDKCTQCDSSDVNRNQDPLLFCPCLEGYYQKDDIQVCQKCPYSCVTCEYDIINSKVKCLTCNLLDFRLLNNGECICKQGFYDETGEDKSLCQQCHHKCQSCIDYDNCQSCELTLVINQYRVDDFSQNCPCPTQEFYEDSIQQICVKCFPTCQTCDIKNEKQYCKTCKSGVREETTKQIINSEEYFICRCPNDGFYYSEDGLDCLPCHYSCKNCIGPNKNQCTECDTVKRQFDTNSNQCLCYDSFYDDGNNLVCKNCFFTCKTCIDGDAKNCLTCKTDNPIYDFTDDIISNGYCDCETQGEYLNIDTLLCDFCHYTCKECIGKSSFDCLECGINRTLKISGDCVCNQGFYEDIEQEQCSKCDSYCGECVNNNQECLQCIENYELYHRYGIDKGCICLPGYYVSLANYQTQIMCDSCDRNCKECIESSDKCTACYDNFIFNQQNNKCECLNNYYLNIINDQECLKCLDNCQECVNGNQCKVCFSNYLMEDNNSRCVEKPSFSYVQFNNTHSLSCEQMGKVYLDQDKQCYQSCPENFGLIKSICVDCPLNCKKCSGEKNQICNKCKKGYDFCENKCVKICDQQSQNPIFQKDDNVQEICLTKFQIKQCNNEKELCEKSKQYIDESDNNQCKDCFYSCLSCGGPNYNNCLTCNYPRSFIQNEKDKDKQGICFCEFENTDGECFEENQSLISAEQLGSNLIIGQVGLGAAQTLFTGNGYNVMKFVDYNQQIGQLSNTNVQFGNNYGKVFQNMDSVNFFRTSKNPEQSQRNKRMLVSNENAKLNYLNDNSFVFNCLIPIILLFLSYFTVLVARICFKNSLFQQMVDKNLYVFVFIITVPDIVMYILLLFQENSISEIDTIDLIAALIMIFIILITIIELIYSTSKTQIKNKNKNKSQNQQQQQQQLALYYVDENASTLSKNIFTFLLIKKILFVISSVAFKDDAFTQIIICFSIQCLIFIILLFNNPYNRKYVKLFSIINEGLLMLIYGFMLYFVISQKNDNTKPLIWQQQLVVYTSIFMLAINLLYILISLYFNLPVIKAKISKLLLSEKYMIYKDIDPTKNNGNILIIRKKKEYMDQIYSEQIQQSSQMKFTDKNDFEDGTLDGNGSKNLDFLNQDSQKNRNILKNMKKFDINNNNNNDTNQNALADQNTAIFYDQNQKKQQKNKKPIRKQIIKKRQQIEQNV